MTAQRFIDLAARLGAYTGVMSARYQLEQEQNKHMPTSSPRSLPSDDERRTIPSDGRTLRTDPALADIVDYETAAA